MAYFNGPLFNDPQKPDLTRTSTTSLSSMNPLSKEARPNIDSRKHSYAGDATPRLGALQGNRNGFLGKNSARQLQPGHTGSQNRFHVMVRRLTQHVLSITSMFRLCSGSDQACSRSIQVKAIATHVRTLKRNEQGRVQSPNFLVVYWFNLFHYIVYKWELIK